MAFCWLGQRARSYWDKRAVSANGLDPYLPQDLMSRRDLIRGWDDGRERRIAKLARRNRDRIMDWNDGNQGYWKDPYRRIAHDNVLGFEPDETLMTGALPGRYRSRHRGYYGW
jgi:hypothetical protein